MLIAMRSTSVICFPPFCFMLRLLTGQTPLTAFGIAVHTSNNEFPQQSNTVYGKPVLLCDSKRDNRGEALASPNNTSMGMKLHCHKITRLPEEHCTKGNLVGTRFVIVLPHVLGPNPFKGKLRELVQHVINL